MIEQGLASAAEKAAESGAAKAAGAGATKAVTGTTAVKAAGATGGKTLAAKALALVPGIPVLAVGGLVGIIVWEFWKGNRDAKEMKQ